MRMVPLGAIAVAAVLAAGRITAAQAPAADIVQAAQAALGGDPALSAVSSFVITGTLTRSIAGMSTSNDLEVDCVLPDRFIHITKAWMSAGPLGNTRITTYDGFNGLDPIHLVVAPGAPFPPEIVGRVGGDATSEADRNAARLAVIKRTYAEWVIPRFLASTSTAPFQFEAGDPATATPPLAGDDLAVADSSGHHWRLVLDAHTHLPARLAWTGTPIVTMTTSSRIAVDSTGRVRGGSPPAPPPGDPTVGLADVEWRIDFSDYRSIEGLTWPYRIRTSFGGAAFEDLKVSKVRINVPIDAKVFRPSR